MHHPDGCLRTVIASEGLLFCIVLLELAAPDALEIHGVQEMGVFAGTDGFFEQFRDHAVCLPVAPVVDQLSDIVFAEILIDDLGIVD